MDDTDEESVEGKGGLARCVADKPQGKAEGEEGHRIALTPVDEYAPGEAEGWGERLNPPAHTAVDNPAQDFNDSEEDTDSQADFFDQQRGRTKFKGKNPLQGLSHLLAADEGEPLADSLRAIVHVSDGLVGAHT